MKNVLLILLLALSFSSIAQSGGVADTGKMNPNHYWPGNKEAGRYAWRLLAPPQDTVFTKWGIAQKGTTLYVGNGTYWTAAGGSTYTPGYGLSLSSNVFSVDTTKILNYNSLGGFTIYQDSTRTTIGTGSGVSQSNWTFRINDSIHNAPNTTWGVFSVQPEFAFTNAPYSSNFIGIQVVPRVGALNTQDWTGTVEHSNLNAVLAVPWFESGATGTFSSVTSVLANISNRSATATIDYGYLFRGRQGVNDGTINYMTGLALDEVTRGTLGNTWILIGDEFPVAGNWSFYNKSSYRWYTGTGSIHVGDTTDNGTGAKLQVDTSGLSTGRFITTGSTPTVTPDANAGTGATSVVTGNDVSGNVVLTVGTGATSSVLQNVIRVNFSRTLPSVPKAIILFKSGQAGTASSLNTNYLYPDLSTASTTGFDIKNGVALNTQAGFSYTFSYIVIL
jgi:hypothetical protein